jgi:PAS domain S-box-containing protein
LVTNSRSALEWLSTDLIEILPAAVYVCDAEAVVVSYNRRASELWGRSPKRGDTDVKFCGSHKMFRPDGTYLPHRETPMELVLRTGEAARDQEVVIERPDGSRVTVLVNIAPLFNGRGTLIGAVNCFQDLSAHNQSESEQLQLREDLHHAQKIQALGELSGGIAHDFNNLINEITGSLDLMRMRIKAGHTDDIERLIEVASKSAHRAGEITHRLLAFARRQSLDTKSADVNALVVGMWDMLRRTLGEDVSSEMRLDGNLWAAMTDANQLESVLLNLVINARDAMSGGGRLIVETMNTHLDEDYVRTRDDARVGDYVMLSVSDTGCGMPAEVAAKAFDPFFTTKPIGQGTGLGLSMVHGFAKQSGGHVRIHSEVGRGSSIKLYLRRAAQEAEQPSKIGTLGPQRGQGQTVMVVDDNEILRGVMAEVVKELGYNPVEAPDAPTAITILKSDQPIDLFVTDVGMPIVNGRQLAEIARNQRPDLKVLFVTGYAPDATNRGEFLAPGMELLTKPFSVEALGAKMQALLKG